MDRSGGLCTPSSGLPAAPLSPFLSGATWPRLGREKIQGNDETVEGWRFVAFTRLVPLFPFNVLNYAFGLTKIRFFHYVVASFFCMLPGAAAYTFIGYAGREAALGGKGLVIQIAAEGGLLLFVSMLPRLIKAIKGDRK